MAFIQAICYKLEKCWPTFQYYPNAVCFNLVHLCPSMLFFPFVVFLLCCLSVLNAVKCNLRMVLTNLQVFLHGLLNMLEKEIITSVIEIQKENWG